MFKAIAPVRLYETVTDQIVGLIRNNKLKPGDRLPSERELAEELSISRGSLREAFRVLESRGLIKSNQGGGRFVRGIHKDDLINTGNVVFNLEKSSILELIEAREIFEVKIVELAAQRATYEDMKAIENFFVQLKEGGESNSETSAAEKTESDTEFHIAIAKASHNFVFVNIMRLHFDLLKDTREKTWKVHGRRKEQINEHWLIFEAIKEKNSEKAAKAMLNHLRNIRKVVLDI